MSRIDITICDRKTLGGDGARPALPLRIGTARALSSDIAFPLALAAGRAKQVISAMRSKLDWRSRKFQNTLMSEMFFQEGGLAILAGRVLFDARFAVLVATGAALLSAGWDHGLADLAGLRLRRRKA
jgi:hypothetical protein